MGTGVMLLNNPCPAPREVCCDLNSFIANFYRSVKYDYEATAEWADWPTIHQDLTAWHRWLLGWGAENSHKVSEDPEYYDCKVAGRWCWGQSSWIGHGWCDSALHPLETGRASVSAANSGKWRPTEQRPRAGRCRFSPRQPARGGQAPEGARRRRPDPVDDRQQERSTGRAAAAGPDAARQPHARRQGRQRAAGRGGRAGGRRCLTSRTSGRRSRRVRINVLAPHRHGQKARLLALPRRDGVLDGSRLRPWFAAISAEA